MRLLLESQNGYRNMAEDEALIKTGSKPTLRLYTWKPSAVSIGYFQSIEDEVDIDFCRKNGIDIIRRNTGGGAVFHDESGELTYSLIYPLGKWNKFAKSIGKNGNNIMETYKIICNCLILGFEKLGIEANFKPINDIETDGKKISGNAQTRREGYLLQHGTLLYSLNTEKMFKVLKVSDEKIRDKRIASAKERVTSIILQLDDANMDFKKVIGAMVAGFETELKEKMKIERLKKEEKAMMEKLAEEKYSCEWWNYQR